MWEKIRVVFTIPELRQKILLTLLFLGIFRIGTWIPLPVIDQGKLSDFFLAQYEGHFPWSWYITCVLTMTSGTVFLMWLGEQIDEFGIGNGISLLIMAGILARMPAAGYTLLKPMFEQGVQLGGAGGV